MHAPPDDGRSRAQRAVRDARRLQEGPGPLAATVEPPVEEDPRPQARPAVSSRLLEVDEVYVGSPSLGAVFAYRDAGGEVLADVEVLHIPEHTKLDALIAGESRRHVDERWVVVADEEPVFFVEQYRATGKASYGVFDPDGGSLATFVPEGGIVHREVLVREASSAPVATIRADHHRHVITSADGYEIGYCWREFSSFGSDEDEDVWGLRILEEPDLLDRRALVAMPLVCQLLAYRKRHFDRGGEIGIILLETVPPVGLAVIGVERALDGLYWLRRRLD